MKKRIIALLLSFSVLCCSLSFSKRASAAPAGVAAIVAIGVLAWEIIGVCTGAYDDTAEAIGEVLSGGWDGMTNPDSPFQQNWKAGWHQICDTVTGWFNAGELEIAEGRIKLTYEQFHELYSQLIVTTSKPSVDFISDFNCYFLSADLSLPIFIDDLPHNEYFSTRLGQAFSPVFYNDDKMIFADYYLSTNSYIVSGEQIYSSWGTYSISSKIGCCPIEFRSAYKNYQAIVDEYPVFNMSSLNTFKWQFEYYGTHSNTYNSLNCFLYENGKLSYVAISDVDLTGMTSGLISTSGTEDYCKFLQSLRGYTATTVPPEGLDNLSGTIPTDYNPSLSFPTNPDLSRPINNQVIVGDVPGSPDLPLSDYQTNVDIDIDIPSIIVSKFPFCIPFDFVRFLGVLLSDPIAPVFRIPISTSPENLEQWEGNQTVEKYLNPDNPMFEIDEEIVIDLSVIPLVQPICYTCFIVGFIFLLLHITPKMIQH